MTATFHVGDAIEVMGKLPEKSVDLILTSPPFLALRSYLPANHPDKALEGGSQATPGEYIDWLIDVVEACDRVLAPHGSLCIELGDTYAGSGGAGGDYNENGLREGQPVFRQVASREHRPEREGTGADGGSRVVPPSSGRGWPLPKSLSLIPELFRFTLVYGTNPLTGRTTDRWRLRNVVRWVRPNPPVGALGDKFRPATSELMVFCKSAKRFFDLDAVRGELSDTTGARLRTNDKRSADGYPGDPKRIGAYDPETHSPNGAPPLDWWNIPPGGYVTWPERVNPGEYVDGTLYIESAGCPLHAGLSGPVAMALHGEPANTPSSHSSDTDANPAPGQQVGSVPIDQPSAQTLWDGSSDSPNPEPPPAAKRRNKPSNKTAPAPATSPLDTASDRTPHRTGDTSSEPLSDAPHPDSPENRTSAVRQAFLALESYARTGHKPAELEGCSCSFAVNVNSTSHYAVKPGKPRNRQAEPSMSRGGNWNTFPNYESSHPGGAPPLDWWEIPPGGYQGSHYAVFPPELCIKPIKAMCPEKVCKVCGEPSRRIVESERVGFNGGQEDIKTRAQHRTGGPFEGGGVTRVITGESWSDCGHDDYRPGRVLDPFGGSGTTALVATGHGRDCILIDLDERNYELALQRVGPFILERAG